MKKLLLGIIISTCLLLGACTTEYKILEDAKIIDLKEERGYRSTSYIVVVEYNGQTLNLPIVQDVYKMLHIDNTYDLKYNGTHDYVAEVIVGEVLNEN